MKKRTKKERNELIKSTRRYLKTTGDPNLKVVANHLKEGMDLYLKMLKVVGAASKVKLPAGISVKHVDFETTNDKAKTHGIMAAAVWVGDAVKSRFAAEKAATVPYFGSDSEDEYKERVKEVQTKA